MRNIKIVLLATTAAVLFTAASCEKDENGNRITYYKNKTGEGYVFFKFKNDSIAPIANAKIEIESYAHGMYVNNTHFDYVYTDNNGKYSFKFVKKIYNYGAGSSKVAGYEIKVKELPPIDNFPVSYSGDILLNCISLDNSSKIFIDTIFYYYR